MSGLGAFRFSLRLFTLDNRLIMERKGRLAADDVELVNQAVNSALG